MTVRTTSMFNRADVHKAVDLILDTVDGCAHEGKQRAMTAAVETYFHNLADVLSKLNMLHEDRIAHDAKITVTQDGSVVIASDMPQ